MTLAISNPSGYFWDVDPSQHVVYTDTSASIQEFYYRFADFIWNQNNLTLAGATQGDGPAPPAAGDPSGYTWGGDLGQHVVYRGALDSHVHELFYGAGPQEWRQYDLTEAAGGATLAAGAPVGYGGPGGDGEPSVQRVAYVGVDSHVHLLSHSGYGWQAQDLTEAAGGPTLAAGDPSPYLTFFGNPVGNRLAPESDFAVTFRGIDAHIHQFVERGDAWLEQDLTLSLAAGDPDGFDYYIGGVGSPEGRAVVYRDVDSHIDLVGRVARGPLGELSSTSVDLTDDFGAPLAAGDPVALGRWPLSGFNVFYRGVDSHIHEIKAGPGFSGLVDLNDAAGGAPPAAGDPTVYVTPDSDVEPPGLVHVVYRGADSRVYELYGTNSEGWHLNDLTEAAAHTAQAAEHAVVA